MFEEIKAIENTIAEGIRKIFSNEYILPYFPFKFIGHQLLTDEVMQDHEENTRNTYLSLSENKLSLRIRLVRMGSSFFYGSQHLTPLLDTNSLFFLQDQYQLISNFTKDTQETMLTNLRVKTIPVLHVLNAMAFSLGSPQCHHIQANIECYIRSPNLEECMNLFIRKILDDVYSLLSQEIMFSGQLMIETNSTLDPTKASKQTFDCLHIQSQKSLILAILRSAILNDGIITLTNYFIATRILPIYNINYEHYRESSTGIIAYERHYRLIYEDNLGNLRFFCPIPLESLAKGLFTNQKDGEFYIQLYIKHLREKCKLNSIIQEIKSNHTNNIPTNGFIVSTDPPPIAPPLPVFTPNIPPPPSSSANINTSTKGGAGGAGGIGLEAKKLLYEQQAMTLLNALITQLCYEIHESMDQGEYIQAARFILLFTQFLLPVGFGKITTESYLTKQAKGLLTTYRFQSTKQNNEDSSQPNKETIPANLSCHIHAIRQAITNIITSIQIYIHQCEIIQLAVNDSEILPPSLTEGNLGMANLMEKYQDLFDTFGDVLLEIRQLIDELILSHSQSTTLYYITPTIKQILLKMFDLDHPSIPILRSSLLITKNNPNPSLSLLSWDKRIRLETCLRQCTHLSSLFKALELNLSIEKWSQILQSDIHSYFHQHHLTALMKANLLDYRSKQDLPRCLWDVISYIHYQIHYQGRNNSWKILGPSKTFLKYCIVGYDKQDSANARETADTSMNWSEQTYPFDWKTYLQEISLIEEQSESSINIKILSSNEKQEDKPWNRIFWKSLFRLSKGSENERRAMYAPNPLVWDYYGILSEYYYERNGGTLFQDFLLHESRWYFDSKRIQHNDWQDLDILPISLPSITLFENAKIRYLSTTKLLSALQLVTFQMISEPHIIPRHLIANLTFLPLCLRTTMSFPLFNKALEDSDPSTRIAIPLNQYNKQFCYCLKNNLIRSFPEKAFTEGPYQVYWRLIDPQLHKLFEGGIFGCDRLLAYCDSETYTSVFAKVWSFPALFPTPISSKMGCRVRLLQGLTCASFVEWTNDQLEMNLFEKDSKNDEESKESKESKDPTTSKATDINLGKLPTIGKSKFEVVYHVEYDHVGLLDGIKSDFGKFIVQTIQHLLSAGYEARFLQLIIPASKSFRKSIFTVEQLLTTSDQATILEGIELQVSRTGIVELEVACLCPDPRTPLTNKQLLVFLQSLLTKQQAQKQEEMNHHQQITQDIANLFHDDEDSLGFEASSFKKSAWDNFTLPTSPNNINYKPKKTTKFAPSLEEQMLAGPEDKDFDPTAIDQDRICAAGSIARPFATFLAQNTSIHRIYQPTSIRISLITMLTGKFDIHFSFANTYIDKNKDEETIYHAKNTSVIGKRDPNLTFGADEDIARFVASTIWFSQDSARKIWSLVHKHGGEAHCIRHEIHRSFGTLNKPFRLIVQPFHTIEDCYVYTLLTQNYQITYSLLPYSISLTRKIQRIMDIMLMLKELLVYPVRFFDVSAFCLTLLTYIDLGFKYLITSPGCVHIKGALTHAIKRINEIIQLLTLQSFAIEDIRQELPMTFTCLPHEISSESIFNSENIPALHQQSLHNNVNNTNVTNSFHEEVFQRKSTLRETTLVEPFDTFVSQKQPPTQTEITPSTHPMSPLIADLQRIFDSKTRIKLLQTYFQEILSIGDLLTICVSHDLNSLFAEIQGDILQTHIVNRTPDEVVEFIFQLPYKSSALRSYSQRCESKSYQKLSDRNFLLEAIERQNDEKLSPRLRTVAKTVLATTKLQSLFSLSKSRIKDLMLPKESSATKLNIDSSAFSSPAESARTLDSPKSSPDVKPFEDDTSELPDIPKKAKNVMLLTSILKKLKGTSSETENNMNNIALSPSQSADTPTNNPMVPQLESKYLFDPEPKAFLSRFHDESQVYQLDDDGVEVINSNNNIIHINNNLPMVSEGSTLSSSGFQLRGESLQLAAETQSMLSFLRSYGGVDQS